MAWCVASGEWAGEAAARYAEARGPHVGEAEVRALGGVGLRPEEPADEPPDPRQQIKRVQAEVLPLDKGLWREAAALASSLAAVDGVWGELRRHGAGASGRETLKTREAAALTATARWIHSAALARRESRGLHRRTDFPDLDPAQRHHLRIRGLEQIVITQQPTAALA